MVLYLYCMKHVHVRTMVAPTGPHGGILIAGLDDDDGRIRLIGMRWLASGCSNQRCLPSPCFTLLIRVPRWILTVVMYVCVLGGDHRDQITEWYTAVAQGKQRTLKEVAHTDSLLQWLTDRRQRKTQQSRYSMRGDWDSTCCPFYPLSIFCPCLTRFISCLTEALILSRLVLHHHLTFEIIYRWIFSVCCYEVTRQKQTYKITPVSFWGLYFIFQSLNAMHYVL